MIYAMPGSPDAIFSFKSRYENFIGGEWLAPVEGKYLRQCFTGQWRSLL